MIDQKTTESLKKIANECRLDIINMLEKAGSGHPGGSLSVIDIITTLFFHEMKINPKNPLDENRDRFVLSKGHGVPALYAVFAKLGFIQKEDLMTLRMVNSKLQGHPDRVIMPIVEASTGSLGQGLSIAQGMALGLRLEKKTSRVFCVIGDGESQEGQIWEAAMSAPKFKLNNLVVFLDNNNGQIDGHINEVMEIEPILDKWRAFNWFVQEVDGHNFEEICFALEKTRQEKTRPSFILARTVKGKGVSFMENNIGWHGVTPNKEEAEKAREEIKKVLS
jgi:transketolase